MTTGSGAAVLNSNNKVVYVGKTFNLKGAVVQHEVNHRVLWISNGTTTPMLLVVSGNTANQVPILAGDLITAAGTVQRRHRGRKPNKNGISAIQVRSVSSASRSTCSPTTWQDWGVGASIRARS